MQKLLNDRRVLLPVIVTAVAIAVGAMLIVLLSGDASSDGSGATPAASSQSTSRGAVTIDIADYKFKPETVTLRAGGKVSWVNHDSTAHTATDTATGAFDTGALKQGQSKTVTLRKPGTYAYICQFHPFMKATVIVK
ncbi:MAG TPA: cupredoxin domain-containing protein [Solirubrobacteraceae bacterium]|jgi:plastocyanin|nr:cupredoxin domain-containing protein [Solirubrobacteraceae bacterium]